MHLLNYHTDRYRRGSQARPDDRDPLEAGEALSDGGPLVGRRSRLHGACSPRAESVPADAGPDLRPGQARRREEAPLSGAARRPARWMSRNRGPGGDLLHARAGAGLAEHLTGGVKDAVMVPDGIAPDGPRSVLSWLGQLAAHDGSSRSGHSLSSPTMVPPATMDISACSSCPAVCPSRRIEGMSRPASAASTRPAAMAAKPADMA